jgi:hypothetical protein
MVPLNYCPERDSLSFASSSSSSSSFASSSFSSSSSLDTEEKIK